MISERADTDTFFDQAGTGGSVSPKVWCAAVRKGEEEG